eukprot:CAMPEP_0195296578 /NCGR_PEP_ID=MMETSP0707-20130614/19756_1 /TAXON_ID=33640 /ORGANISM="Asterionellopsis glacialis, Strain CCMP134" /LENGTH=190 /DNA_ID=CAMNT_0040358129 /DNA_START=132 /DNA_END=704 /DNA_ORIENTATION=+
MSRLPLLVVVVVLGLAKSTKGFSVVYPSSSTTKCQSASLLLQPKTAFPKKRVSSYQNNKFARSGIRCNLVTEEQVLEAVEASEKLWEEALEARKKANALSEQAETLGEEAASSTEQVANALQKNVGLDQIENAKSAINSSLDAGSILSDALEATKEADQLEAKADNALAKAEELLSQHLVDFPENDDDSE